MQIKNKKTIKLLPYEATVISGLLQGLVNTELAISFCYLEIATEWVNCRKKLEARISDGVKEMGRNMHVRVFLFSNTLLVLSFCFF